MSLTPPGLAQGDLLAGWRVTAVEAAVDHLRVTLAQGDDALTLGARPASGSRHRGPWDVADAVVYHEATALPFARFDAAGRSLARRVADAGGGSPGDMLSRWIRSLAPPLSADAESTRTGPERGPRADGSAPWQVIMRRALTDRPGASVHLSAFFDELPPWPCVLPWTRLELNEGGRFGPCCSEYQASAAGAPPDADPVALWNGPAMRAFRRAMVLDRHPEPCRRSCPVLHAGSDRAGDVVLRGGPQASVEAQVAAVEDILAGREEMRAGPLSLVVSTTSYCNYDCLMCDCGERGTLDDERTDAFWFGVRAMLPGLRLLSANGGEPLASPAFRRFLEGTDFAPYPQLEVALTTNGSYLTARQLERLARVPFGHLTLSLNAATPATYLAVNRGLPWERIRENLDEVVRRRADGSLRASVSYSMVLLRSNVHEVDAFAALAERDGAEVRYLLPHRDRNHESIMTRRDAMESAREALARVAEGLLRRGREREARVVTGSARVLSDRLRRGVLTVL
jgi:molybdenum cofactor biosynthesis enzyme MoaA